MGKNEEPNEEMTVELSLDNGQDVTCAVITILTVEAKDNHPGGRGPGLYRTAASG